MSNPDGIVTQQKQGIPQKVHLCGFLTVGAEFDRTDATVYWRWGGLTRRRAGHREQGHTPSESRVPAALSSFWKVWVVKVDLGEAGTEGSFEVRKKGSNNCRALLKVSEPGKNTACVLRGCLSSATGSTWNGQRDLGHEVTRACGSSSSGGGME